MEEDQPAIEPSGPRCSGEQNLRPTRGGPLGAKRLFVRGATRVSPEGPLGSYYKTFDRPSSFIGGSAMNEGMTATLMRFDRLNEGTR